MCMLASFVVYRRAKSHNDYWTELVSRGALQWRRAFYFCTQVLWSFYATARYQTR